MDDFWASQTNYFGLIPSKISFDLAIIFK